MLLCSRRSASPLFSLDWNVQRSLPQALSSVWILISEQCQSYTKDKSALHGHIFCSFKSLPWEDKPELLTCLTSYLSSFRPTANATSIKLSWNPWEWLITLSLMLPQHLFHSIPVALQMYYHVMYMVHMSTPWDHELFVCRSMPPSSLNPENAA